VTVNHAADVAESEGAADSMQAQRGVFDTDSSGADEHHESEPVAAPVAASIAAAVVASAVPSEPVIEPVHAAEISVSTLPEETHAAPAVEATPPVAAESIDAQHAQTEGFVVKHEGHAEAPATAPSADMFEKPVSRPVENPFGPTPKVAEVTTQMADPFADDATPVPAVPVAHEVAAAPAVEPVAARVEAVEAVEAEPVKTAPVAPTPTSETVAAIAEPAPVVAQAAAPVESEPVKTFAPVETKPVETKPVETVAQPAAPAPAPVELKEEALKPMLETAGLVWVNTDADKLRAAREAAAQAQTPQRVVRERKRLPPLDAAPMQQVETGKDAQQ
jgi:ribonuclease E